MEEMAEKPQWDVLKSYFVQGAHFSSVYEFPLLAKSNETPTQAIPFHNVSKSVIKTTLKTNGFIFTRMTIVLSVFGIIPRSIFRFFSVSWRDHAGFQLISGNAIGYANLEHLQKSRHWILAAKQWHTNRPKCALGR